MSLSRRGSWEEAGKAREGCGGGEFGVAGELRLGRLGVEMILVEEVKFVGKMFGGFGKML